ncbi:MAG TPA: hypothetical protein VKU85_06395, partial [bacterium]|nr:hypothetical protein [bacterium]
GFDPDHPGLGRALQAAREARVDRAERITARLTELGVPVTMDSVREIAGIGAVGRPHVARALLEAGHVTSIRDAFDLYLGDGKPACEPKDTFDPATAIDLVHRAGGVAVAAHPGVNGGPQELVPLLALGLDGVEVRHPNHGRNSQEAFDEFARIHGLLRTGGSDFHGPRLAGLGVGTVSIPRDWWDDLERGIQEKRAGAAGPRVVPEES